jgi:hypothetical protein
MAFTTPNICIYLRPSIVWSNSPVCLFESDFVFLSPATQIPGASLNNPQKEMYLKRRRSSALPRCSTKLSLCLIKHYATKAWRSGGIAPPLLTSALDGSEQSASRPRRFNPGPHSIRNWVGPRAGLDTIEKRHFCPLLGIEPRPASPSLYQLNWGSRNSFGTLTKPTLFLCMSVRR